MRKTILTGSLLLLALGLALSACEPGPNSLRITLPDQDARDQTVRILVSAMEPGEGAGCPALLDMSARPGDEGYSVVKSLDFAYPPEGDIGDLSGVGSGQRIFYAEAENEAGDVILNGCKVMDVGDEVIIALDWIADDCQPTNGGVEICDGVDNDCDESTDEGDPATICEARDNATATGCVQGLCQYECEQGWFDANDNLGDGCECRPTRDGEEWCDGIDNDCDGEVDGAGCTQCTDNGDCSAPADCMGGTCDGGTCEVTYFPDDTTCNDGNGCTENESCQGGFCIGTARDCTDGLDCTSDDCDAGTGQCVNELLPNFCLITTPEGDICVPDGQTQAGNGCRFCSVSQSTDSWTVLAAGVSCDDGLWCTGEDTCDENGECQHTNLPCTETCYTACDEGNEECLPDEAGTGCDDGFSCTDNEACDGEGVCVGVAIDGYCGAEQECLPGCASDAIGCVDRPSYIAMNCPPEAALTSDATCSVELVNGEGLEGCLQCQVELLPSIISETELASWSACTLGNWEMNEGVGCFASSGGCPNSGSAPTQCCSGYSCDTGNRMMMFVSSTCAGTDSWRLQQSFDFSSFSSVQVAYGVLQSPDMMGGGLAILTDPGDDLQGTEAACDGPGSWSENMPSYPVVTLPGSVTAMDNTRVSFVLHDDSDWDPNNAIGLDSIKISAYPPECDSEVVAIEEPFTGCGSDFSGEHNGWTLNGATCIGENEADCGNGGGLLLGNYLGFNTASLDATVIMELDGYVPPGRICWNEYTSAGFPGSYEMNYQSYGSGPPLWIMLFESQMAPMALNPICREICIDVNANNASVIGNNSMALHISGATTGGYMLLNDFRVYASEVCDASGVLSISEVEEDGQGGLQVRVTNDQSLPRRARITCTWGNEGMTSQREVEYKACTTLDTLLTLPDGNVNRALCPVYVTYKGGPSSQYTFIQHDQNGPGTYIYGAEFSDSVEVGDRVQLTVTQLGTFTGMRSISAVANVEVLSQNNDIDALVQDLSAGIPPSADLVGELVRINSATVDEINGSLLTISYGTASGVILYAADQPAEMCVGATFDILCPAINYNGTYELRAYKLEDFTNLNTLGCN